MQRRYRKSDVQFHREWYDESRPAVNVKCYKSMWCHPLPLDFGRFSDDGGKTWQASRSDPRFTHEWIREHLSDSDLDATYEFVIESLREQARDLAAEVFGKSVKLFFEGRSGGWAVPHGLPPFASWDAIDVARWARFERQIKLIADDVPYALLDSIYYNDFLSWLDEQATRPYCEQVSV